MRHGRSSYAFNGYKRHVATELDTCLIVAAAITTPEQTAMPVLRRRDPRVVHRSGIHRERLRRTRRCESGRGDLPSVAVLESRLVRQGGLRHVPAIAAYARTHSTCVASQRSRTSRTHIAAALKCRWRGTASPPKPFGGLGRCPPSGRIRQSSSRELSSDERRATSRSSNPCSGGKS
jgi:hypothetical protein